MWNILRKIMVNVKCSEGNSVKCEQCEQILVNVNNLWQISAEYQLVTLVSSPPSYQRHNMLTYGYTWHIWLYITCLHMALEFPRCLINSHWMDWPLAKQKSQSLQIWPILVILSILPILATPSHPAKHAYSGSASSPRMSITILAIHYSSIIC